MDSWAAGHLPFANVAARGHSPSCDALFDRPGAHRGRRSRIASILDQPRVGIWLDGAVDADGSLCPLTVRRAASASASTNVALEAAAATAFWVRPSAEVEMVHPPEQFCSVSAGGKFNKSLGYDWRLK